MSYKRLFVLVEGNDDERFFDGVLKQHFERKYDSVVPWKYAEEPPKKVSRFIKSIKAMGADYIFMADYNLSPCISARRARIKQKYRGVDESRVIVVIKEIEGWYLAGLDINCSKELRISSFRTTDDITKEQFDRLIPKRLESRVDFMREILNRFSVDTGKRKNRSLRYFFERYDC